MTFSGRDGGKDMKKYKRIILEKRCDMNDIECHVIMTLSWGEREREHWPFPRLTAGATPPHSVHQCIAYPS